MFVSNKKHSDAPPPKRLRALNLCLNNRAVSLTEALVAAGMVGGLSLGYLQLSGDHQKSQKKIEAGFEIDMLTLEMAQTLSNDDACTKTLRNKTSGTVPDIRNSVDKALFKAGKKYGQNLIQLKTMELKNLDKAADGFGSLELEVTFEKNAKIIRGKKEETRKIPLTIQESGGTVICNPDPATRYLASDAKQKMCDSIKGTFNPATQKCTPPFIGQSCPHYIAGFDSDGKAICDRYPAISPPPALPSLPPPPAPSMPPSSPAPPTPPTPPELRSEPNPCGKWAFNEGIVRCRFVNSSNYKPCHSDMSHSYCSLVRHFYMSPGENGPALRGPVCRQRCRNSNFSCEPLFLGPCIKEP